MFLNKTCTNSMYNYTTMLCKTYINISSILFITVNGKCLIPYHQTATEPNTTSTSLRFRHPRVYTYIYVLHI